MIQKLYRLIQTLFFQYVSAESLYSTTIDDIAVGDIVAITTDEDGLQEVIILDYDADDVIE